VVLGAASPLTCASGFELGYDFLHGRRVAHYRIRNGMTPQGAEALSVPDKVKIRDGDFLTLDVAPDIDLGPIEQWLHPHMFARGVGGDELSQKLRWLILVIPLGIGIARREITLLGPCRIFITS